MFELPLSFFPLRVIPSLRSCVGDTAPAPKLTVAIVWYCSGLFLPPAYPALLSSYHELNPRTTSLWAETILKLKVLEARGTLLPSMPWPNHITNANIPQTCKATGAARALHHAAGGPHRCEASPMPRSRLLCLATPTMHHLPFK